MSAGQSLKTGCCKGEDRVDASGVERLSQADAFIQGFSGAFAGWAAVEQGYLANRVLECVRVQVVCAARSV